MNYKIAVLITVFLRDATMYRAVQSIIDNQIEDCVVLIADQGYRDEEKTLTYDFFKSQIPCEVHYLPFDCGLSAGRNYLVKRAQELGYKYCLLASDSMLFVEKYNLDPIIRFLETNESYGVVGFELENSVAPWEYLLEVKSDGIHFKPSTETEIFEDITFKKVDICRNLFLAKTEKIIDLWDVEFKLGEHELAFIELQKRNVKVFWTDNLVFKKINISGSDEYKEYRKRLPKYLKLLRAKLNINSWIIYDNVKKGKK